MKRRILDSEEQQLWERITSQLAPLDRRARQPDAIPDVRQIVGNVMQSHMHREWNFVPEPLPTGYDASQSLACGAYAGIDRNTSDRFRKGELPLDGTMDLHGMSREKAHATLSAFIHRHYQRGSRFLLVITGKGSKKDVSNGNAGVLRESLPHWLAEPGLRPFILTFDTAQVRHGGSGAYYLLLRRKRGGHG